MSKDIVEVKVKDVCGPHCVGIEDGAKVFERVLPILQSGGNICLNFKDVLTITSSFLNASIGKLYGYFNESDLQERFRWKNTDKTDDQLIQLVINNAREHFAKGRKARQAEADITERNIIEEE